MGVNNYTKKWERLTTYGGKLSADATQATAREIMAHNLPAIEDYGFEPILLVHDEVVTEAPDCITDYTVEILNDILSTQPPWAQGLPLAAGGFEAYRYRKE
jgi:DNA polymerase